MDKKFKVTYKRALCESLSSVVFNTVYEFYGGLSVLCDTGLSKYEIVDIEIL